MLNGQDSRERHIGHLVGNILKRSALTAPWVRPSQVHEGSDHLSGLFCDLGNSLPVLSGVAVLIGNGCLLVQPLIDIDGHCADVLFYTHGFRSSSRIGYRSFSALGSVTLQRSATIAVISIASHACSCFSPVLSSRCASPLSLVGRVRGTL